MDFAGALEEFVKQRKGAGLIPVTVSAVDLIEMVFDGKDGDGNEYLDIRMNATTGETGLIVVPKIGSSAIILDLGNQSQDYVMIQAGDVSGIRLVDGQTEKAVKGESLNSNLNNLFDELDSLISNLQNFATTQAAASTGTLAPLAAGYASLNANLTAVKAELTTIKSALNDHLSDVVKLG